MHAFPITKPSVNTSACILFSNFVPACLADMAAPI